MGSFPFAQTVGNAPVPLSILLGGTGKTTAPAAFNALNPNAAPANYLPANPAGTVSTTQVMMGLGITYTPASSGLVLAMIAFGFYTLTAATSVVLSAQYGTGAAPANGAAVTGTLFGGNAAETYAGSEFATSSRPIAFMALLSLSAGTAYWFDVAVATTAAADEAVIQNVSAVVAELPAG